MLFFIELNRDLDLDLDLDLVLKEYHLIANHSVWNKKEQEDEERKLLGQSQSKTKQSSFKLVSRLKIR